MLWIGLAVAAVVLLGIKFWVQSDGFARQEALERTAARAGADLETLDGVISADEALSAPLSGRACVMWRLKLERYSNVVETIELDDAVDFTVEGAAERVRVRVADMTLDAPPDPISALDDPRLDAVLAEVGWERFASRVTAHEMIAVAGERVEVSAAAPPEANPAYRVPARPTAEQAGPGLVRTLRRRPEQQRLYAEDRGA